MSAVRTGAVVLLACAGCAIADMPQMGGSMSHLLVTVFEQQVYLSFESPAMSVVELQRSGSSFDGAASVLNGTLHNSQFGWLANGFVSLPSGAGVFVRELSGSEHLSVYSESGFDPILGTDGSDELWQWDGTMTHNWYASRVAWDFSVRYEVFVGDASGQALAGWGGATIDLGFTVNGPRKGLLQADPRGLGGGVGPVPAPTSLAAIGLTGLLASRRRR